MDVQSSSSSGSAAPPVKKRRVDSEYEGASTDAAGAASKTNILPIINAANEFKPLETPTIQEIAREVVVGYIEKEGTDAEKDNVKQLVEVCRSLFEILDLPEEPRSRISDDNFNHNFKFLNAFWREYQSRGKRVTECFGASMLRTFLIARSEDILQKMKEQYNEAHGVAIFLGLAERVGLDEGQRYELLKQGQQKAKGQEELQSVLPSETGLGFLSRDQGGKTEEDMGIISFQCITNDRNPDHMVKLINIKNIFSRQLPKMPREYIVRLVLDRNHYSYCLLKKGKVIGGVCFRPYFQQRFAEIAFLAITAHEQVKGYGTRLMNHLKEHVKTMGPNREGIEYFLTYADNFAIGYFKKQGFTKTISMPRDRWHGFIKDYDGGTLMECYIDPRMPYLNLGPVLKDQNETVLEAIKIARPRKIFEGLTYWKQNPTGKPLHPLQVPGIAEAGWREAPRTRTDVVEKKSLKKQILAVLRALQNHKSSWPFHKPVSKQDAPDYDKVIAHPTDISTMMGKNKNNEYTSKAQFGAELKRMFQNCREYNQPNTIYYKYATEVEEFIMPKYDAIEE